MTFFVLFNVNLTSEGKKDPLGNNHEKNNFSDTTSFVNMDFRNLHKISFHLVYKLARHQNDPQKTSISWTIYHKQYMINMINSESTLLS